MGNRGEMSVILQPRTQMMVEMQPSTQASRIGDYNELLNKPSINGVELQGDKTSENLKITISKSAEEWETFADVVSDVDTHYVYIGTETKIKIGDGATTIGDLPFVSAEDPRITNTDITNWNNKSDFSGSYNDLTDKPDIPDDLADLNDDTNHRLVTDVEKQTWDNKSNFSGNYNDLTNKPIIPTALSELTDDSTHRVVTDVEKQVWSNKSDFSGSYTDLTNKPDIPDDLSDLRDDTTHRLVTDIEKSTWNSKSDFSGSYTDLTNKPNIPTALSDLTDDTTHRTVTDSEKTAWNNKSDFSGNYNDLSNKPTIPDDLADLNEDSTHRTVTDAEKTAWSGKSDFSGSYTDLTNKPTLADLSDDSTHRTVTDAEKTAWSAKSDFSGSYNDLTDKPSIPDELTDLSDVSVNNIQNGQILKWNSSTSKFENANETGGGGSVNDAYKSIKIANTVISASGEDTFEIAAGTNVTITPDAQNKKIIINATGGGGTSTGDMLKEIYDTNNDGIVNAADEATTLTGLSASITELNYVDGVTSSIQTQLNNKANTSDIPDELADLADDTTHRLVTDTEKSTWNAKSDFSGSYNDLTNKPTIPDDLADLNDDATHRLVTDTEKSTWNNKSDFSGSYTDLTNKPTIPDDLSDLNDDSTHRLVTDTEKSTWNAKSDFSGNYNDLTNKPTIPDDLADLNDDSTHRLVTDAEKTAWSAKSDFSGSYNDLSDKPTIPSALSDLSDDSTHRVVTDTEKSTWNAKSDFSGSYTDLTNKPTIPDDLADLNDDSTHRLVTDTEKSTWNAKSDFSGSYNDLTDKPTIPAAQVQSDWNQTNDAAVDYIKNKPNIPTVNDAVLTITQNGTSKGTFSANASSNETIALTDTTYESKQAAQSGTDESLVTTGEKYVWNNKSDFSGNYNDLSNKPTIPDEVSDLSDVAISNIQNGQILKWNSTTSKFENANESGGGGSGGHTIEDASGADMTQRTNLQFADVGVADDSTNDRTKIEAFRVVSSVSDLTNATDGLYMVNADDPDADIPTELNDLDDVALSNVQNGQILKYNSTTQKFENANESGGGSGGHTVENPSGTDMTQRTNLQFVDAGVTDDSTNDRTKVENVQVLQTVSDLTNASDGLYLVNTDEATVADATMIAYGSGTVDDVLDGLGTASTKDVPVSGNASTTEVVMGNDSRLTDARTPVAHTHTVSQITDFPSNVVQDASYVHTDSNYTSAEKTKLAGITANATKTEASDTNGNIVLNDTETPVYRSYGNNAVVQTDKAIFLSRQALNPTGFKGYVREKLLGCSYGWNQLLTVSSFVDNNQWASDTVTSNGNNKYTITFSGNETGRCFLLAGVTGNLLQYHKYLIKPNFIIRNGSIANSTCYYRFDYNNIGQFTVNGMPMFESVIFEADRNYTFDRLATYNSSDSSITSSTTMIFQFELIDLSCAFGTTMATQLYDIANNGGIALMREAGFPIDKYVTTGYYLSNNKPTAKRVVAGNNLWDEEYLNCAYNMDTGEQMSYPNAIGNKNPIIVSPNTSYYFKIADNSRDRNVAIFTYDANGTYIERIVSGGGIITLGNNVHYINFYWETSQTIGVYDHTFCINISDASINGNYYPSQVVTYPLGNDELCGRFKYSNGEIMVLEGDTKESNGVINHTWDWVDLYSLTWTRVLYAQGDYNYFKASYSDISTVNNILTSAPIICPKYVASASGIANLSTNKRITNHTSENAILIRDDLYTDATTFKNSLYGVKIAYQKATPSVEQSTPFAGAMDISGATIEEYVDTRTVACPVSAERQYMGQSEDIIEIPSKPNSDGNWALHCDVSGNAGRYYWKLDDTVADVSDSFTVYSTSLVDTFEVQAYKYGRIVMFNMEITLGGNITSDGEDLIQIYGEGSRNVTPLFALPGKSPKLYYFNVLAETLSGTVISGYVTLIGETMCRLGVYGAALSSGEKIFVSGTYLSN